MGGSCREERGPRGEDKGGCIEERTGAVDRDRGRLVSAVGRGQK